jgi:hypothetical protein
LLCQIFGIVLIVGTALVVTAATQRIWPWTNYLDSRFRRMPVSVLLPLRRRRRRRRLVEQRQRLSTSPPVVFLLWKKRKPPRRERHKEEEEATESIRTIDG